MPYFLAYSSPFAILLSISTSDVMFRVAPWKGLTWLIKLPISSAICSLCSLISRSVDSLWFESVFKFIFFFNSFLSLASTWKFRMKSLSALIEALYPPLIGSPLALTSLLMATAVTKSPGIVENLFPLRLSPGTKASKSEKAWGFVNYKFVNSTWCSVKYRT